jgi:hypothetical protein
LTGGASLNLCAPGALTPMRRTLTSFPSAFVTKMVSASTIPVQQSRFALGAGDDSTAGRADDADDVDGLERFEGAHTPQLPPPRQCLHLEQFVHTRQLALPVQLAASTVETPTAARLISSQNRFIAHSFTVHVPEGPILNDRTNQVPTPRYSFPERRSTARFAFLDATPALADRDRRLGLTSRCRRRDRSGRRIHHPGGRGPSWRKWGRLTRGPWRRQNGRRADRRRLYSTAFSSRCRRVVER